jgi:hypothetical protein
MARHSSSFKLILGVLNSWYDMIGSRITLGSELFAAFRLWVAMLDCLGRFGLTGTGK